MENERKRFPEILISRTDAGVEAAAGVKLRSILIADLLVSSQQDGGNFHLSRRLDPRFQLQATESFLSAMASSLDNQMLELHLTVLPDLAYRPHGGIWITLFLRSFAPSEEKAKESVITGYLSLMPLLFSLFPEVEFEPLTSPEELLKRVLPFRAYHAVTIQRRREMISLTTPVTRSSIGFGSQSPQVSDAPHEMGHLYPWVPTMNDRSLLLDCLMGQLNPVQVIIRIKHSAVSTLAVTRLKEAIRKCEDFLNAKREYQITLNKQAELLRNLSLMQLAQLNQMALHLGVFMLTPGRVDPALVNVLGHAVTGSCLPAEEKDMYQGGFTVRETKPESVAQWSYSPEEEPFTLLEAAGSFIIPAAPTDETMGLPVRRCRTAPAKIPADGNPKGGDIKLFVNEHRGINHVVSLSIEERMRHTFIIGQTGTGKSTLMEKMILQDIRAGRGLAVIDPHGDMIDSILGRIPKGRAEDVVLFDMVDRERPLGFNLIQSRTVEERDLIVDELYLALDHIYDMKACGGPIFEANFRGMLRLLMGEGSRGDFVPTLLEFTSCYLNSDFRRWLKNSIADRQVLDFIEELEKTGGEASLHNVAPYITSKFSRFINDTTLMRIVGQEKTSFDFDEIMNKGKIFLVKLGKGRFGSTVSALIANQLVARFKLAAMKRGDMPPEDRRDFMLYVDECQNLPGENFIELLSQARKFGMGLVLATQYTAQLADAGGKGNGLLSAILGNVGTILIFRLGQEDAVRLAPVLHPYFSSLDIVGLPNWQGYARMQTTEDSMPPFSFRTRKDETPYTEHVANEIRNLSRLKYGTDRDSVDAQILHRRSLWKDDKVPF
jgi:hypothetical protein